MTRRLVVGISVLLVFIVSCLSFSHACSLSCNWLELVILALSVALFPLWVYRAPNPRRGLLRMVICIFTALFVQLVYLSWLHSDYFPDWLLDARSHRIHRGLAHEKSQ